MTSPRLRILFATGECFLPDVWRGAERSTDDLVRSLLARGHEVEVLAGVPRGAARRTHRVWRYLTGGRREARRDHRNGYPTHRAIPRRIDHALREGLRRFRPDLVVVWNRACDDLAREAAAAGVPCLVWVHDAAFTWHEGLPPDPSCRLVAVSEFLAARARARLARPVRVLRPALDLDAVRALRRRPEFVTLVNPRVDKGVEVALSVAERLPARRFLLVGARAVPRAEKARLTARVRALRNVRVVPRALDMRTVYARTALLLVPSQCEDAAPRVVLEANANGIPVVGSRVGGIPEVGGDAATLLAPAAGVDLWADAVEAILGDPRAHARQAEAAHANAARPEFRTDAVVDAFLDAATPAGAASRTGGRVGAHPPPLP